MSSVAHSGLTEYRRRIEVRPSPGVVDAELEDNFHHFALRMGLDGTRIVSVDPTGVRPPWETCVSGASGVRLLHGMDLATASDTRSWRSDPSIHCTHMADLTVIAVAHALDRQPLRYDMLVRPPDAEVRDAWLFVNGVETVEVHLDGAIATGPAVLGAGVDISSATFGAWARANLEPQWIEPYMAFRRALHIGRGAMFDFDSVSVAGDLHHSDSSCFTYRPGVGEHAKRNRGRSITITVGPRPQREEPI
jgi:hypothetical protein